jgi:hypothetical protein
LSTAFEEIAAELDACGDLAYICDSPSKNNNMMHTIRLRVDDRVYQNLMWLLGKFSKWECWLPGVNSCGGCGVAVGEARSQQLVKNDFWLPK